MTIKKRVIETLKDYAIKSLVNTVDYLGSMTYKVNDHIDKEGIYGPKMFTHRYTKIGQLLHKTSKNKMAKGCRIDDDVGLQILSATRSSSD